MLISGILSLIAGVVVFRFVASGQSKSFLDRPMLFNNAAIVLVLHLLWLLLIGLGLYFLWQVNPTIVLVLIGLYAVLWVAGYIVSSKKNKAKKIFKLYKQLQLHKPQAEPMILYRETISAYFRSQGWEERRTNVIVDIMLENKTADDTDIKDIASAIFSQERGGSDFGQNFDFKRYMKQSSKEQAAIETAYAQVIGEPKTVTERPELSSHSMEWLKSTGLNPDDMSNEQLQVFAEVDDHRQSSWLVRILYGIAGAGLLLAIISLLFLDWWSVISYLVLSFVLWFIGNKIQMRRIGKKFHEASIAKYAMEQSAKNKTSNDS